MHRSQRTRQEKRRSAELEDVAEDVAEEEAGEVVDEEVLEAVDEVGAGVSRRMMQFVGRGFSIARMQVQGNDSKACKKILGCTRGHEKYRVGNSVLFSQPRVMRLRITPRSNLACNILAACTAFGNIEFVDG